MRNLRNWLAQRLGESASEAADEAASLKLATAALLVEVLRADDRVAPAERRQVVDSLGRQLGLGQADCEDLLELAEKRVDQAHDLYQFTSQVNRACTAEEKVRFIEQLWRVAGADAVIHKYEEHMIRRIADLLYVPHRDFIAAKLRSASSA
jgi:uncharacterized tellurite resistance protein B-like protein